MSKNVDPVAEGVTKVMGQKTGEDEHLFQKIKSWLILVYNIY